MPPRRSKKRGKYSVMPKGGMMRRSVRSSSTAKQLAVMVNPFSVSTTNPKIPDGLGVTTAGLRLQSAGPLNAANGQTIIHCILHPGLPSGMATCRSTVGSPAAPVAGSCQYWPYSNHISLNSIDSYDRIGQTSDTQISKWRLVSQGLRLSLINNSDNNEGWWQACRIQIDQRDVAVRGVGQGTSVNASWAVVRNPVSLPGTNADAEADPPVAAAPATWENSIQNLFGTDLARDMLDHSSYQSGKLRDIHKHMFTLNPSNEQHQFVRFPREVNQGAIDISPSSPFIDPSFDALYIRIYATETTKLLAHIVSNQEIIYDENTHLARYQSECEGALSSIASVYDRMKNIRPSRLALP
jgi:hypothetical protein